MRYQLTATLLLKGLESTHRKLKDVSTKEDGSTTCLMDMEWKHWPKMAAIAGVLRDA
jgi:hypothetical protein